MSLYNKYRPRDWDSVIGQEYIITILRNSLTTDRVHHAYLFHGSRGTGKTTSARILAKALNCLDLKNGNPCHECENCKAFDDDTLLDIVEIDGASNNGVENVRDLIERARFEPNQAKYKVYIIDEVHMLSTGAFNALLKTLEQPPKHVKFILATTEIDKVPETIRSRALRFDFRKIGIEDIIKRLEYVCQQEGLKAEDEALKIIAKSARGGLRDALTLLEQNMMDGEVSTEHVRYTLALIEESMIDACIEGLKNHDVIRIQSLIETLKEKHIEARSFLEQLMYRVRDFMVENLNNPEFFFYSEILEMLESAYTRVRAIPDGMMLIEITLLRIVKSGDKKDLPIITSAKVLPPKPEEKLLKSEIMKEKVREISPASSSGKEKSIPEKEKIIEQDSSISTEGQGPGISRSTTFSYPSLITKLKETHPALMTDLKTARFTLEDTHITLIFSKKWNYDRVNTPKIKSTLSEMCAHLFSGVWEVRCKLDEKAMSEQKNMAEGVF